MVRNVEMNVELLELQQLQLGYLLIGSISFPHFSRESKTEEDMDAPLTLNYFNLSKCRCQEFIIQTYLLVWMSTIFQRV